MGFISLIPHPNFGCRFIPVASVPIFIELVQTTKSTKH